MPKVKTPLKFCAQNLLLRTSGKNNKLLGKLILRWTPTSWLAGSPRSKPLFPVAYTQRVLHGNISHVSSGSREPWRANRGLRPQIGTGMLPLLSGASGCAESQPGPCGFEAGPAPCPNCWRLQLSPGLSKAQTCHTSGSFYKRDVFKWS